MMVEGTLAEYQSAGANAGVEMASPAAVIFSEDCSDQPSVRNMVFSRSSARALRPAMVRSRSVNRVALMLFFMVGRAITGRGLRGAVPDSSKRGYSYVAHRQGLTGEFSRF